MIAEKNRDLVVGVVVSLVALLVYANTLGNGFVWDDDVVILTNKSLTLSPIRLLAGIDSGRSTEITPYYRPLTLFSFLVEGRLHGFVPYIVRLFNVLLHVVNSFLLYRLSRSFALPPFAALIAGLLFAVHPLNSEAVDFNAGGRNTMLATFFVLSSYLVHQRSLARFSLPGAYAGAALFLAGLFSKETALALLPFIWYSEFFRQKPLDAAAIKRSILRFFPFVACCVIYLVLRNNALSRAGVSVDFMTGLDERLMNNVYIIPRYLLNVVWPAILSPKYYIPEDLHQYALSLVAAWIGIAGVVWWLFFRGRSWQSLFGLTWLIAFWLPVSGIFPIPSAPLADRYMYLPAIGLWIIIADQFSRLNVKPYRRIDWRLVLPCLCLIVLAVTTIQHNMIWRSDISLFTRLVELYPDKAYGYHNLGCAYMDKAKNLDMAEREFERALALDPVFPRLRTQMGYARLLRGDLKGALEHYNHAIYQNPFDAEALLNRGEVLERLNRMDEAAESYRRFLATPGDELPEARIAVRLKLGAHSSAREN